MAFIETIYARARENRQRIAIPECLNEMMLTSAVKAAADGLAEVVLVEDMVRIEAFAMEKDIDISGLSIADNSDEAFINDLADRFSENIDSMFSRKTIRKRMRSPLYTALVMEALGDVDCTFGGLDTTTYEFILAAQGIIGLEDNCNTASAMLIYEMSYFEGEQGKVFGMSDGAICIDPDVEQLSSIALSCCDTFEALTGREARCAMVSYSTDGSGSSPDAAKMAEAARLARSIRPEAKIDGEFQSDAALIPRVAAKKVKRESDVAGRANVLVFPTAAACNIGTKLLQIFADCKSYGPVYQGFRKPILECSRGDTEERIYDNIALACVCAGGKKVTAI